MPPEFAQVSMMADARHEPDPDPSAPRCNLHVCAINTLMGMVIVTIPFVFIYIGFVMARVTSCTMPA